MNLLVCFCLLEEWYMLEITMLGKKIIFIAKTIFIIELYKYTLVLILLWTLELMSQTHNINWMNIFSRSHFYVLSRKVTWYIIQDDIFWNLLPSLTSVILLNMYIKSNKFLCTCPELLITLHTFQEC